ncbi:MAG: hypothetical protein AAGF71_15310, partial [Pseudomonadota bacterium]
MPTVLANGDPFPTPETEFNSWVFGEIQNVDRITSHAWGIWAALTASARHNALGISDPLVYQTWLSPSEIYNVTGGQPAVPKLELRTPLHHNRGGAGDKLTDAIKPNEHGIKVDRAVAEVVAYSPAAARHAVDLELFYTETLESYLENGYKEIPNFPKSGVTIKPVYKLISEDDLNSINGRELYAMPAWPGTPDTSSWSNARAQQGFPNTFWGQCVYIDMALTEPTTSNGVDPDCDSPTDPSIYSLADFINVPLTDADMAQFVEVFEEAGDPPNTALAPGQTLILVGMHVGTREMKRWTWQTNWWSADADNPNGPSSASIAAGRVGVVDGPAAHYAMATAYSMLVPAQPLTGGRNVGSLVPAYNPHLEAPFGPSVLQGGTATVLTPEGGVTTNLGVESNCMTCHNYA